MAKVKSLIAKLKKDPIKPIFIIIGLVILVYVCFYYLKLTHFPIGDDPAHHVSQAIATLNSKSFFSQLTHSFYPVANLLFAGIKILSFQAWPMAFIITICLFLLFGCFSLFCFATKVTKDARIGIAAAVILASSRWLFDNIRTGLLAEVLAWGFFILTSYFFVKRKLIGSLILLAVLAFSHPLVFAVTLMIFFCYSLVLLTDLNKEKGLFLAKFWGIILVLAGLVFLILPSKVDMFMNLAKTSVLVGARPLKIIFTEEGFLRFMVYIMGTIGVIFSLKHWKKDYIKYFLTLLVVSILMVLSYQWGLRFYVFRLYTYLEIAFAFFAAYGLVKLIDCLPKFKFSQIPYYLVTLFFTIILIIPNVRANTNITNWQKTDYSVEAVMPPSDLATIYWINDNLSKKVHYVSETRWGAWLESMARVPVYENEAVLKWTDSKKIHDRLQRMLVRYIFVGKLQDRPGLNNSEYFELIYNNENSRVYRVIWDHSK